MAREPDRIELSPAERRRVARTAVLRPWNLVVLVAGLGIFATTLTWWLLPLTLAVYVLLVVLAYKNPLFQSRALEWPAPQANGPPRVSPERRARWLPRGETRQKVEEALDAYRKVLVAIEESDDVTRGVLEDTTPRLDRVADRLVDVAHRREKAAQTIREVRSSSGRSREREAALEKLEEEVKRADAEISSISERLVTLRAKVVRVSLDSGPAARTYAEDLNSSLDEINFRLEALGETLSEGSEPPS